MPMTRKDLEDAFTALDVPRDAPVRVQAFGGMRQGKDIEKVSGGFDWDAGAVIIIPAVPLTMYRGRAGDMKTGIFVRAERDDGTFDSVDVADLTDTELARFVVNLDTVERAREWVVTLVRCIRNYG